MFFTLTLVTFDSPANHDLLSVVKGARNGFVYGVKIREYASKHAVSRILTEIPISSRLPARAGYDIPIFS